MRQSSPSQGQHFIAGSFEARPAMSRAVGVEIGSKTRDRVPIPFSSGIVAIAPGQSRAYAVVLAGIIVPPRKKILNGSRRTMLSAMSRRRSVAAEAIRPASRSLPFRLPEDLLVRLPGHVVGLLGILALRLPGLADLLAPALVDPLQAPLGALLRRADRLSRRPLRRSRSCASWAGSAGRSSSTGRWAPSKEIGWDLCRSAVISFFATLRPVHHTRRAPGLPSPMRGPLDVPVRFLRVRDGPSEPGIGLLVEQARATEAVTFTVPALGRSSWLPLVPTGSPFTARSRSGGSCHRPHTSGPLRDLVAVAVEVQRAIQLAGRYAREAHLSRHRCRGKVGLPRQAGPVAAVEGVVPDVQAPTDRPCPRWRLKSPRSRMHHSSTNDVLVGPDSD